MKLLKVIAINFALAFGSVEIISFIFFKEKVRILFSEYWHATTIGRGYPRYHFVKHPERGFDIGPDSKTVLSHKPNEIKPYPVWGNHIGCFDKNIKNQSKYIIYLAGDSFTWGYAPLENKFGTLLEKKLKVDVAACGVSHTGQRHQFQKFKAITKKLGYFPEIVFINVFPNDIDNDFSHPHTTVIKGYKVDNAVVKKINNNFFVTRKDDDALNSRISKTISTISHARFGRFDPRKYSASSVLLYSVFFKPLVSPPRSESCKLVGVYGVSNCMADDGDAGYPINAPVAKNNRKAIKEWIQHSNDNGYKLVFADINTELFNHFNEKDAIPKYKDRQFFCKFIKKQDSLCFSFVNYLDDIGIKNWFDITWKGDSHFNLKGNQLYADFLTKIYKDIK